MRFREQVVVVTGAGHGIGPALAERFAAEGAALVVAESDPDLGRETAQRLRATFVHLDARDVGSVARAVDEVLARHGRIDVWVNNTGTGHTGHAVEVTPAGWDAEIGATLSGAFYCAHYVGKAMIAQGRGAMVNIASVDGLLAQKARASRCVSHAGLIMLTQVLASEWGLHGVRVNAVAPGILAGDPQRQDAEQKALSRIPMGRLGEVNEIVEAVTFLASDEASFMTGSVLRVDGGWTGYHLFYPYETAFASGDEE